MVGESVWLFFFVDFDFVVLFVIVVYYFFRTYIYEIMCWCELFYACSICILACEVMNTMYWYFLIFFKHNIFYLVCICWYILFFCAVNALLLVWQTLRNVYNTQNVLCLFVNIWCYSFDKGYVLKEYDIHLVYIRWTFYNLMLHLFIENMIFQNIIANIYTF